jgi:hypothetical protein
LLKHGVQAAVELNNVAVPVVCQETQGHILEEQSAWNHADMSVDALA